MRPVTARSRALQPLQCSLAEISGTRSARTFFNQGACVAPGGARSAKAGKAPQKLRVGAPRDTRLGIKEMRASYRHPARVSATLLHKHSSLYDAMRAIIGSELRLKLDVPKAMPSYLDDLLFAMAKRHSLGNTLPRKHTPPGTHDRSSRLLFAPRHHERH